MKSFRKTMALVGLSYAAFSQSASSHIIIENMEGRAGYNEILTLVVPHGCGPAATTQIRMQVPDGMTIAVPEQKDGWETQVIMKKLDTPIKSGARILTEVAGEFVWTGNLPSNQLGMFKFMGNLPQTPDKYVFFKTIQSCGDQDIGWVDTLDAPKGHWEIYTISNTPAPFIKIKAAEPQLGISPEEMAKKFQESQAARQ